MKSRFRLNHDSCTSHSHCEWHRRVGRKLRGSGQRWISFVWTIQPSTVNGPRGSFRRMSKRSTSRSDFLVLYCAHAGESVCLHYYECTGVGRRCQTRPASPGALGVTGESAARAIYRADGTGPREMRLAARGTSIPQTWVCTITFAIYLSSAQTARQTQVLSHARDSDRAAFLRDGASHFVAVSTRYSPNALT